MHRFLASLALALAPTLALMSSPAGAEAARRPLQRLSVELSSDPTSAPVGAQITYTLRVTNTGRETIAEFFLVMDPPPSLVPVSESCGPVTDQAGFPSPDGLWCEYSRGLDPGESVTMTLGVQLTQVYGYNPPITAMVGCATIVPQVGGILPIYTCAASALD